LDIANTVMVRTPETFFASFTWHTTCKVAREVPMKKFVLMSCGAAALAGLTAYLAPAWGEAEAAAMYVTRAPAGYRDWRFISVAREEAPLDDIRAVLGNDLAIQSYRQGKSSFPEGAAIVRLAYAYEASDENNRAFGRQQSYVAGHPKNGVQFMIKDTRKYAATGGWGYGHFDAGKSADESMLNSCFPCHEAVRSRDFVFTRYSP
jgi:hypothetical protein